MAENLGKTTAHEKKNPLPLDVHHSKTALLKLSNSNFHALSLAKKDKTDNNRWV